MYAYLVAGLCLVWVGVTVGTHLSAWFAESAARFDVFALVPSWSFFAPNPATTDPRLVYRDKDAGGNCGAFREVADCAPIRGMFGAIWNPKRRLSKSILDVLSELLALSQRLQPHEFKLCAPYLMLANYIIHFQADDRALSRQFAIVSTEGWDDSREPVLLFVSEFHALPKSK